MGGGRAWGGRLAGLALAWLAGVALQLQQAAPWPLAAYAGGCALALALAVAVAAPRAARHLPGHPTHVSMLLVAGSLAFCVTGWHASVRLAQMLPAELEGRDLVLTGVVAGLPRAGPDRVRFVFDVEEALHGGRAVPLPARVSLAWYRERPVVDPVAGPQRERQAAARLPRPAAGVANAGDDGPGAVRAGQRWRLTVRLKRPHGLANPNGFDLELWLFERGIRATGYVRGSRGIALLLDDEAGRPVERLRQRVRDAIAAQVPDPRAAGVLAALAVGDQQEIEREDWDLFRATGTAHLMAISGLHVTMFAWLAGAAVAFAWRRSGPLVLWLPTPLAARWGGLAAATSYALLAGWGVPAQRTVWMLAVAVLLATAGVRWPRMLVLAAAAVVVTALDPWALLQPGFWLSFVAVGLLLASEPAPRGAAAQAARHERMAAAVHAGLRTQLVATLGLAPLTLLFFGQVSVVGFVANLAAIPVVTLVVTPLALLGVAFAPLWAAGAGVLQGLTQLLSALAAAPGSVWTAAAAPGWAQAGGLIAGVLLVLPLPWRLRLLALPLLLPLLVPPLPRPAPGQFEMVAADVGQGNAVLVRTRGHLLVYDTGPQYGSDSDAGARVLLPLLAARGETAVDVLVLSHRDSDHVGGARALIDALPVREVLGSLEEGHPLRAKRAPFVPCAAGRRWQWDGVRFEVLHPAAFDPRAKPNGTSCVLRVAGGDGTSVLLAGDIEAAQEASLVAAFGDALMSDVLLVPHHGSRTSSSEAFLHAVAPRVAVVQAGYRNRFGHPAPDVVSRYGAREIVLVDSAGCGAWTWRAGAAWSEGAAWCERQRRPRYWRAAGVDCLACASHPTADARNASR